MIVSKNSEPNRNEFDNLLSQTISELNRISQASDFDSSKLAGREIEPFIRDIISEKAIGTPFEDTIELISGQKFPDIIAKKYYGIEVKTTQKNHWKTTGNSVLENTRVENIERIFMLFAKLADPIEFRCRPYEEVLSEVVVTHSPRYLIDMNLKHGHTIFDKISIPYDVLRKEVNPVKPIVEYYKKGLKPGEDLWWMDSASASSSTNIVIRVWKNLSIEERDYLMCTAMVLFPEIFGGKLDKFQRFSIYLINRESVLCPNVRDIFTSGGKGDYKLGRVTYRDLPRVFIKLFENIELVNEIISNTDIEEINSYWPIKTTISCKKDDWVNLVSANAKRLDVFKKQNIEILLDKLLNG